MSFVRLSSLFIGAALAASPLAAQAPAGESFTFDIAYTPGAAAIVARTRYPMRMIANYEGDPLPGRERYADEMSGTILLGEMRAPLPSGTLHHSVPVTGLDRARLSWVRAAMVGFNVFPEVPERDMSRLTVDTTMICQTPEQQTLAEATTLPIMVICRTMRETR